MDETKIFKILLDGKSVAQVPITKNTKIGTIKQYFRDYLKQMDKNVRDYAIKIYLTNDKKLDVDNTSQYDNISLNSVWNNITNGYIVLIFNSNYFARLYTDAIYQIVLKLDLESLTNLCLADKRMSRICRDDVFWMNRVYNDFGVTEKPNERSWKNHYKFTSIVDVVREHLDESNFTQIDVYEGHKENLQKILEGMSESDINKLESNPMKYLDVYNMRGLFFRTVFNDFDILHGQIYNNGTAGYYDNVNNTDNIQYGFEQYFNFGVGREILSFLKSYQYHARSKPEYQPRNYIQHRYSRYDDSDERNYEEEYEEESDIWNNYFYKVLDPEYYNIDVENFINTVYKGILFG